MIQVQFCIEVRDATHFDVNCNILSREDANDLERDLARKIEALFSGAFRRAAVQAGLNVKQAKVNP